jgi:CRP-like cAMP-binding protein
LDFSPVRSYRRGLERMPDGALGSISDDANGRRTSGRPPMHESKLRSVSLFSGLSPREVKRIASVTDEVVLPSGTTLISEGSFSYEFLVIASGSAEVRREDELLATLGPGDFAGEVGVMRDARRNASVVAVSELTAIVMTARDLRQIAQEMPSVGAQIDAAIEARAGEASH